MPIDVDLSLGQLPPDYCFTTWQKFAEDLTAILQAQISGNFSGVIISSSTPASGDRDKFWIKIDNSGKPVGQFKYLGGWLWPNPRTPSGLERMIWKGTEAELWSYDGGDGTDPGSASPTETTGAMWQRDTDFDFKLPVGAGTNPAGGYDGSAATQINIGDTGGVERHQLVSDQMPKHHHAYHVVGSGGSGVDSTGHSNDTVAAYVFQTDDTGGDKSHPNMPPYRGVVFAKRTARRYYVG